MIRVQVYHAYQWGDLGLAGNIKATEGELTAGQRMEFMEELHVDDMRNTHEILIYLSYKPSEYNEPR